VADNGRFDGSLGGDLADLVKSPPDAADACGSAWRLDLTGRQMAVTGFGCVEDESDGSVHVQHSGAMVVPDSCAGW
jgi:hypothetical protein